MAGLPRNSSSSFSPELIVGGLAVAFVCTAVHAGPTGGQVVAGQVSINQAGLNTTITASNNSIINFSSFNLGARESVRFIQPGADSRVLNRITNGAPTFIDGSIFANGRVFFINPAGVTFGAGSVVTANQIIAGAGTISNADFLRGVDRVSNIRGDVTNLGALNANSIALLGRRVENFGSITAPDGSVVLASGSDILIGRRRDRIYAKISAAGRPVSEAALAGGGVKNAGTINAKGGSVSMVATDSFGLALFNLGSIRAADVTIDSGAKGSTTVSGTIDASNSAGVGGQVRLLGNTVEVRGADIDASGATGGGTVLIGGNFQGRGPERNSVGTLVDPDSVIHADATQSGNGGTVVVWSDGVTLYGGSMFARALGLTGDGGLMEVSGKELLGFVGMADGSSVAGKRGSLLLDPRDITITLATDMGYTFFSELQNFNINPGVDVSVSAGQITAILNGGTDVNLRANRDITVNSAIQTVPGMGIPLGGSLSLEAGASILINADISTAGGNLSLLANTSSANPGGHGPVVAGGITVAPGVTLDAGVGNILFFIDPFSGTVFSPGALNIDNTVTLNALNTIIGGTINNAGSFRVATSTGDLLIQANAKISATDITLRSASGILDFDAGVQLNATSGILLRAQSQITNIANITFRDVLGGSGSPSSMTIRLAGNITDAVVPAASQFGTGTPPNLVLQSDAGSVSITDSSKFGSSVDVTLNGATGVTINDSLAQTLSANSLAIFSGGAVTISTPVALAGNRSGTVGAYTGMFAFGSTGTTFDNASSITAAGLSDTAFIIDHTGAITLGADARLYANTGFVSLSGLGASQAAGGAAGSGIRGSGLSLHGTGAADFTLLAANIIDSAGALAVDINGVLSFTNAGAFHVGAVAGDPYAVAGISVGGHDATLTTTAGGITIDAARTISLTGMGHVLTLDSAGGATQGAGSSILADGLVLKGAGAFTLTQSTNSVTTLAAQTSGSVNYRDADDLVVGALASVVGITTTGGNVTLNSGGTLSITNGIGTSLNAAGAIDLTATNGIGQSQAIFGGALTVSSGGATDLGAANSVTSIGGTPTTGLNFRNTGATTVNDITVTTGDIRLTTTGAYTLAGNITTGMTGRVFLEGAGATQNAGKTITADQLTLRGTGAFTLDGPNDVNVLAANTTGAVKFYDADDLHAGAITGATGQIWGDANTAVTGITSGSGNVSIRVGVGTGNQDLAGDLIINQAINAGSAQLSLRTGTGAISQVNAITAGSLLTITTTAGGTVTLTDPTNSIGTIAGNVGGAYSLISNSSSGITVGSLTNPFGAPTPVNGLLAGSLLGGANVTLTSNSVSGSKITVSNAIDASNAGNGTSIIRLIADSLDVNAQVRSGNSGTSAIWARQFTSGRNVNLGTDDAAKLSLTSAELGRFATPVLQIGDGSTGAMAITAALDLHSNGYNLVLHGSGLTFSGGTSLNMSGHDLTLWAASSGVNADAAVLTGQNLILKGSGVFTLNNAANDFAVLNADVQSSPVVANELTYRDASNLEIRSLTAKVFEDGASALSNFTTLPPASGAGLNVVGGDLNLTIGANDPSNMDFSRLTITDQIFGGQSIHILANNLSVNTFVTAGTDIEIAPVSSTRTVLVGTGLTDPASGPSLVVDQAEINRFSAGNTLIVGSLSVPQFTTTLITPPTGTLNFTIIGQNVLIKDAFALQPGGRLTIRSNGLYQWANAPITASSLLLLGSGNTLLTADDNDFGTIAGNFNGAVRLTDKNSVIIGSLTDGQLYNGLVSNGNNIAICATGNIDIQNKIDAGSTGQVSLLSGGAITQATASDKALTAYRLLLQATDATLANESNSITQAYGHASSSISLTGAAAWKSFSDFTMSTPVSGNPDLDPMHFQQCLSGLMMSTGVGPGSSADLTLCFNGLFDILDPITADTVHFKTQGLSQAAGAIITTNILWLENYPGAGAASSENYNLDSAANRVAALRGALTGASGFGNLNFTNADDVDLAITSDNLSLTSANAYIQAAHGLTVTGTLAANQVRLVADEMAIDNTVTGNGGILLRSASSGRAVTLGTSAPSSLSLTQTELANLVSSGTVQIGGDNGSFFQGVIVTDALNPLNYSLTLVGTGITIGSQGLQLAAGKTLALNALSSGVTQTSNGVADRITADHLVLLGTGNFTLANTFNNFGDAGANVAGFLNLADSSDLTLDEVSATSLTLGARSSALGALTASGATAGGGGITLNVNGALTVNEDISTTGNTTISSNGIALNADVGTAALTFKTKDGRDMWFGRDTDTPAPGSGVWVLNDTHLGRITASSLTLENAGNIIVKGRAAGASPALHLSLNTLTFNATGAGHAIAFQRDIAFSSHANVNATAETIRFGDAQHQAVKLAFVNGGAATITGQTRLDGGLSVSNSGTASTQASFHGNLGVESDSTLSLTDAFAGFMEFFGNITSTGGAHSLDLASINMTVTGATAVPFRFNPGSGASTIGITGLSAFRVNKDTPRTAPTIADLSRWPTLVFGYNNALSASGAAVSTTISATTEIFFNRFERILSLGSLSIDAPTVTLGDLNVLAPGAGTANLSVTSDHLFVWTHGVVDLTDLKAHSPGWVVQGNVTLNGAVPAEPEGDANLIERFVGIDLPSSASFSRPDTANSYAVVAVRENNSFAFAGLSSGDYAYLSPTGVPVADPATSRAAFNADNKLPTPQVEQANLSPDTLRRLEEIKIFPRNLVDDDSQGALLNDLPREKSDTQSDIALVTTEAEPHRYIYTTAANQYEVSSKRLTGQRVKGLLDQWDRIRGDNAKLEATRNALDAAWTSYSATLPEGSAGSGEDFRTFLIAHQSDSDPAAAQALKTINELREFYTNLDQFGLTGLESGFSKERAASVLAHNSPDLTAAIRSAAETK
jgi:filamentous hemagglutinin family protein